MARRSATLSSATRTPQAPPMTEALTLGPPASILPPSVFTRPVEDDIRRRAYEKWEADGRPDGDGIQYWLQAERELRGEA